MSTFNQMNEPGDTEATSLVKNTRTSQRRISKFIIGVWELDASLPRFGPLHGGDESLVRTGKEEAWQHVLKQSLPTREAVTTEFYLSAVRQVEKEAREAYADDESVNKLTGTEFRWMMIKDGCFFLQLVLILLGNSKQLGYSSDHVIFGEKAKTKDWIRSLFFVGNQIPFVVLKLLMKQSFFQRVTANWKWKRPSDLSRVVLYDFLLLPALEEHQGACRSCYTQVRSLCRRSQQEALDLLHALQLLVVGPEEASDDAEKDEEESILESEGEAEDGDLEAGRGPVTADDQRSPMPTQSPPARAKDDEKIFIRATELRQAGVHFRSVKGKGSKGICFKKCLFFAFLWLPPFPFDEYTVTIFQNLKRYEMIQPICKDNLEVRSYLRFMSELISTPEDAQYLASKGFVQKGRRYHEKLPKILKKLATTEDYNQSFRHLSFKISDYSRPSWVRFTQILSLFSVVISILTIAQTVYTILPYYKKGPGQ